jgi:VanZ family protein
MPRTMSWSLSPRIFRMAFYAVVVVSVIAALAPSPEFEPSLRNVDKLQHMAAFALLAGLARLGFPDASQWQIVERLSFLGAAIEVFQSIPALHRDCDVWDWAADTLAATVAVVVLTRLIARRAANSRTPG